MQYLQNPKIAKDFAVYYDLFNKYRADYQVDKILDGKADDIITARAKAARFDERLSLLGLLLDGISEHLIDVCREELSMTEILSALKLVKVNLTKPGADAAAAVDKQISAKRKALSDGRKSSTLSEDQQYALNRSIEVLRAQSAMLRKEHPANGEEAFKLIKADFDGRVKALKKHAADAGKQLSNVFVFCENAFADGQEMLILVTELTISYYGSRFISRYGCKEYFDHNKELLFYERQKEIISELEDLKL